MRMAYLVRKNSWMSDGERQVARRLGRDWEKQLYGGMAGLSRLDGASAAVFYAAACAVVVMERTGAQYLSALAGFVGGPEEVAVLFGVYRQAQGEAMRAVRTAERLVQARGGLGGVWAGEWLSGNAEDAEGADGDGAGGGMDRIYRMDRMEVRAEKREVRAEQREEAGMAEGLRVERAAGQPLSCGIGGEPDTGWPAARGTRGEAGAMAGRSEAEVKFEAAVAAYGELARAVESGEAVEEAALARAEEACREALRACGRTPGAGPGEEAGMAEGPRVALAAGQPVSCGTGGEPDTGWPAARGTRGEAADGAEPEAAAGSAWAHLPRRERRWRERQARKQGKKAKRAA